MTPRALAGPVVRVVLGGVLLAGLVGCGSEAAPPPDADTASGRSVATTCPLLGTALRKGFVSSSQLSALAGTAADLRDAGDRQTSRLLSALPDDTRDLAQSSDSEKALSTFQADVAGVQRACTDQGRPMKY